MGWFLLYWIVGIIIMAVGWYKMEGKLTVGNLFACCAAAILWPVVTIAFAYVEYEDKVIFQKKNKRNRYE